MPTARFPPSPRYSTALVVLHWLMALLIVLLLAAIEARDIFARGSPARDFLKTAHFMLGLTVLAAVLVRIAIRVAAGRAPAIVPAPPAWQMVLAWIVHGSLYALMLLMPVAGWLILSGEAKAIPFWGLELPPLIGPDKVLAEAIEDVHETAGKIGMGLIALHAGAALFHHYVAGDNTLRRMLPARKA